MYTGKRLFDIVFSAFGLVLLSPLFLLVGVIVKLQDGGPVFFLQERIGRDLKLFNMIKFRTMIPDAAARGPAITINGDGRVTRAGRLLRKLKLDELPQLINVLKGDMSIVGPRPEVWGYVNAFSGDFKEVLKVRPGITDYASVIYNDEEEILGRAENPEKLYLTEVLPAKIELNRQYISDISFMTDVKVIIRTVQALYSSRVGRSCHAISSTAYDVCCSMERPFCRFKEFIIKYRTECVFVYHAAAVAFAQVATFKLLFGFGNRIPAGYSQVLPMSIALAIALRLPLFQLFGVCRGLWRYTGISDLIKIVTSVTAGSALIYFFENALVYRNVHYFLAAAVMDWFLTIGAITSFRLLLRLYKDYSVSDDTRGKKVLIIGAGNAGEMIARDMKKTPYLHDPVGFVDDDRSKTGLSIHGVPILGTTSELPQIIRTHRPAELLIAIPSARAATLRELMKRLSEYKLPIQTLPDIRDVMTGQVSVNQIRPLQLEDLLARPPVKVNKDKLVDFIKGKCVMVTGGGGSIGSEICRQAVSLGASKVIAYERHENSIYNLDQEIKLRQPGAPFYPVVGDVNDRHRLEETFRDFRPDIIYHAAAHKHVPMMEINPSEAICNNVLGTRRVALLAAEHGVDRFVFISTDKAVNPTSVMGATKRACELIVRALDEESRKTKYITVRFGNVLGSSGSVVPLFREQIKRGGPVTVTHPDIVRFLMLIPEAVQLVLQAASIGEGGEIFVLDMGEPIKIVDLARNMIVLSGYEPDKDIRIEYTGLRPGEKLYEELFDKDEDVSLTSASKVFRAVARDMPDKASVMKYGSMLEQCVLRRDRNEMFRLLCRLVNTYTYGGVKPVEEDMRKAA